MSIPCILVDAHLPSSISFTTGPDPELTVLFTLVDSVGPITIPAPSRSPFILLKTISISINDTSGWRELPLSTFDVNMKSAPLLRLVPEQAHKFVTLEPNITFPWKSSRQSFRPFGPEKHDPAIGGQDLYKYLHLGMQYLNVGKEYAVSVTAGFQSPPWMAGSKEVLIASGCEWETRQIHRIQLVRGPGTKFHVHE